MGWRDVLRKYGPAVLTALVKATAATDTPQAAPAPLEPANRVPLTNPPIEMPQPVQPVDTEAAMVARVRVLYKDILNRSRSDITNAEMDEAIDLLRVGREDELVKNLNGRK